MKILITGATDGLGRGLAPHYAREGATLLLHGLDERRGEETIAEIGAVDASFHPRRLRRAGAGAGRWPRRSASNTTGSTC